MNREQIDFNISQYGLHVCKVFPTVEGRPNFGYSIGLFKNYHHPEVLIIGLKLELIHSLINCIGEDIRNGKSFLPGQFYSDIIDGYECFFTSVEKRYYEDYVGQALMYYGDQEFPLLQCIYPTLKNIYPWQLSWPVEINFLQPMLGQVPGAGMQPGA